MSHVPLFSYLSTTNRTVSRRKCLLIIIGKAGSPYNCNGRKHRCRTMFPTLSQTILIQWTLRLQHRKLHRHCNQLFSFFQLQWIAATIWRHVSSLVSSCIANLNQRNMAKQLPTPLRLIAHMNFSLKNYIFELFNLIGTVAEKLWTHFNFHNSGLRKLDLWVTNTLRIMRRS